MPGLDAPCHIRPHGSEQSTVYACVYDDPNQAGHSSTKQTLLEFDGLVELPEGVTIEDFVVWSSIVSHDPSRLTVDELRFALQVGEKLSTVHIQQLAAAFAARLSSACHKPAADKDSEMRAFLSLSSNMQELVWGQLPKSLLTEASMSWSMGARKIKTGDCMTGTTGILAHRPPTLRHNHTPASVLAFLARLSDSDPKLRALTSLHVHCDISTPGAATRLSSALLHHPKLAKLDMRHLSWAPWGPSPPAAAVLHTLPQLTAITSLALPAPYLPPSPPAATALAAAQASYAMAAAITALQALASFTLHSTHSTPRPPEAMHPTPPPPPPPTHLVAGTVTPGSTAPVQPSLDPIIAALSRAPALTDLAFSSPMSFASDMHPVLCGGVHGAFRTLQRLQYCTCASDLIGPMPYTTLFASSPLPALTHLEYTSSASDGAVDSACMQRLLDGAVKHPAIARVAVKIGPGSTAPCLQLLVQGSMNEARDLWTVSVDISPRAGDMAGVANVGTRGLATFTAAHTMAVCLKSNIVNTEEQLWQAPHASWPLRDTLAALADLTSLEFHIDKPSPQNAAQVKLFCMHCLAAPLAPLELLSALTVNMPPGCAFPLSAIVQQVRAMTQLRYLNVGAFHLCKPHELETAFVALTALTFFQVAVRPVNTAVVRSFAAAVGRLPQLCLGTLQSCDGLESNAEAAEEYYASVDWFQGLLALPCRGAYDFVCCNGGAQEGEVEAVKQQLVDRGAKVDGLRSICFDGAPFSSALSEDEVSELAAIFD